MPTNREIYFSLKKENNKYLNETVIRMLLCDANNFLDSDLFLKFDKEVLNYKILLSNIDRVRQGEPIQYVLGYAYFLNEIYLVNKDTLIPRQESEQLVLDTSKNIAELFKNMQKVNILDVGTGSGILAISLKKEFIEANVEALDISIDALKVAKENAKKHNVAINFINADILTYKFDDFYDVIISNPPYIKSEDTVDEQVLKYEPHLALFASPSTLFYECIFKAYSKYINKKYLLAFEIGEDQVEDLTKFINQFLPSTKYEFKKDLYNKYRFLYIINYGGA